MAEGLYKDIKDRIKAEGGKFNASCYIAYKDGAEFAIGNIRFKGAALGTWMEFTKAHRNDLYKRAIRIHGSTTGKAGRVTFHMPTLTLKELSEATNNIAIALDGELQAFLSAYLKKTKRDQVETVAKHVSDEEAAYDEPPPSDWSGPAPDDDVPFMRMASY